MPLLALPFPAINPILVQLGPLAIRWYALSYIAGLILGWALIRRVLVEEPCGAARRGRPPPASTICWSIARSGSSLAGASAMYCFTILAYYFAHPIEIFKIWEGGMAFHGGLIGAIVGILLSPGATRRRR